MFRLILLILFTSLAWANITKNQDEISPQGDTHMGSDAVRTGTNVDDKDLQSQEDHRGRPDSNQETEKTKSDTESQELEIKKP